MGWSNETVLRMNFKKYKGSGGVTFRYSSTLMSLKRLPGIMILNLKNLLTPPLKKAVLPIFIFLIAIPILRHATAVLML